MHKADWLRRCLTSRTSTLHPSALFVYICRLLPLVLRHVRLRPFTYLFFCPFRRHLPCFSSAHLPPPIHLQNQTEPRSRLLSLSRSPFTRSSILYTCQVLKLFAHLHLCSIGQLSPQLSTDALVTNSLFFVALKSEHCAR